MSDKRDAAPAHALSQAVVRATQNHLGAQPRGSFKVFEALHALAIATATISSGTGDIAQRVSFLNEAAEDQVRSIKEAKAAGTFHGSAARQRTTIPGPERATNVFPEFAPVPLAGCSVGRAPYLCTLPGAVTGRHGCEHTRLHGGD